MSLKYYVEIRNGTIVKYVIE